MKAELPTEEDVLAFLVLNMALGELMVCGLPPESGAILAAIYDWQKSEGYSKALEAAAHARLYANDRIHVAAIADSERRLEVERSRDAVVEAAREWGVRIFAGKRTNGDLLSAVCVLEAALMRRGAEVSRHGG